MKDELVEWAVARVNQLEGDKRRHIGWWATEAKTEADARLEEARFWLARITGK